MTNVVNLNKARKAKRKQEDRHLAERNRVVHGISAKVRKQVKARQAEASERLDGHILKSRLEMKKD